MRPLSSARCPTRLRIMSRCGREVRPGQDRDGTGNPGTGTPGRAVFPTSQHRTPERDADRSTVTRTTHPETASAAARPRLSIGRGAAIICR
jgi:hypothetical protein